MSVHDAEPGRPLTERELETLRLVRDGKTNKAAAHAIGCQEQTVKNYVTAILRKLDATDRTSAVVTAIRQGLIEL